MVTDYAGYKEVRARRGSMPPVRTSLRSAVGLTPEQQELRVTTADRSLEPGVHMSDALIRATGRRHQAGPARAI
jgi:hypothetical protein